MCTWSMSCDASCCLITCSVWSADSKSIPLAAASLWLQVALTKRITNRARLDEVARHVIADATDKLLEVGMDEHEVMLFC